MPDGWSLRPLASEVVDLDAGVSVNAEDRPHGLDEIGVLKTSALSGGTFQPSENKTVLSTERTRVRVSVRAESVLVSRMNTPELVGEAAFVPCDYPDLYLPDRIWQLRMRDPEACVVRWLGHYLRSPLARAHIAQSASGTSGSMKNLPKKRFLAMPVNWPPVPEQRLIAAIVDTIDDSIRKTEQIIAKLKQVKQGLLHDLLTYGIDDNGELRDRERHPAQFKDSSLGLIPMRWEVVELGTIVPRAVYGISESLDSGPGIPVLRMMNFRDGEADLSELKFSRSNAARELLLRPGDVLFNRTNSIDHVGRTGIWRGQIEASFASYLVRLEPDSERLRAEFLNRWLNWEATQLRIRRFATPGVHQVNINPTNLRRTIVALPTSLAEQDCVVASLAALDTRIAGEAAELRKLGLAKQGLTEDLLTGLVRVTKILLDAAK
jgi:type I restriction enzyme, S subunit